MKRFCSMLLVALLAVSCWQGRFDPLKVNLDRALKHPVGARDVYAEAVAIPLRCPEGIVLGQETRLLDVAADRFFLLDGEKNEIRIFDWNGAYVTVIGSGEAILDASAYQDGILDVLTRHAIIEYAVADGSFLTEYPFQDEGVTLKSLARVDEDTIFMEGSKDGVAYDCDYIIGKAGIHPAPMRAFDYLVTRAYIPATEVENTRFFRCDGAVYNFLSRSGTIFNYTGDDFICNPYQWDLGKRQPSFTNVQKTADRLYLAFELEGERAVLIYNVKNKQYKAVRQEDFPLGIIYDGCNYHCRPAADGGLEIIRYSLSPADIH
jgi:hypothetical protein